MNNDANCAYNYWHTDEYAFADMGGYDSVDLGYGENND
jgi:hypothetical protein